jgi:hypothetical protein
MNPKLLKWWEKEFDKAVAFACVYGVLLSVDQFAASRHMEAQERDELLAFLIKRQSISPY